MTSPRDSAVPRWSTDRAPRLVVVVQRYGETIVGGAEAHARMVAHELAARGAEVTVLTSCAESAVRWDNALAPGDTWDGPVRVRRHPVVLNRRPHLHYALSRAAQSLWRGAPNRPLGAAFARMQGPWCPALIDSVQTITADRFIFFTYLYYPTVVGAPAAARRGVPFDLVPTAHDEPGLYFGAMAVPFQRAARIAFNTSAEQELVRRVIPAVAPTQSIVGCGTDLPASLPAAPEDPRCAVPPGFWLYLGRDKPGVELLAPLALRSRLVTAGDAHVPGATNLGRVSASDKWWLLTHALGVVQPSRYESLGLTLIESWQVGRPVIVLRDCHVTRRQVEESGGGLVIGSSDELLAAAQALEADQGRARALGAAGATYAARYGWRQIADWFLAPVLTTGSPSPGA